MLRGGDDPRQVARAVARARRRPSCTSTTCTRCSAPARCDAASDAGARTVLHLHNFRLFCAIAIGFRDGEPCFRCRGRRTLPGAAAELPRARCRSPPSTRPRWRGTSPPCSTRSTASSRRATTRAASSRGLGLPAGARGRCCRTTCRGVRRSSLAHGGSYALWSGGCRAEKGFELGDRGGADQRRAAEDRGRLGRGEAELGPPRTWPVAGGAAGSRAGGRARALLARAAMALVPSSAAT